MDYKEKYEMALEGIQEILGSGEDSIKMSRLQLRLQGIFPELAKSEDERIRKEMIFYFTEEIPQCSIREHADKMKEYIAWLEKQGEQPKKNDVCNNCDQQGSCVSPCPMKLVEKQGEQKLAEWTAEDEEELKIALNTLEEAGQYSSAKWLKNVCLVPQTMQKPTEWSEEDRDIRDNIIRDLKRLSGDMVSPNQTYQKEIQWLKSLKERVGCEVNCTTTKEWSEEDFNNLKGAISLLAHPAAVCTESNDEIRFKIIDWLKSLRPQTIWKPSDEHYELEEFAKIVRGNLTGISKAVQKLFETKYLQLTGNKMYKGFKD